MPCSSLRRCSAVSLLMSGSLSSRPASMVAAFASGSSSLAGASRRSVARSGAGGIAVAPAAFGSLGVGFGVAGLLSLGRGAASLGVGGFCGAGALFQVALSDREHDVRRPLDVNELIPWNLHVVQRIDDGTLDRPDFDHEGRGGFDSCRAHAHVGPGTWQVRPWHSALFAESFI